MNHESEDQRHSGLPREESDDEETARRRRASARRLATERVGRLGDDDTPPASADPTESLSVMWPTMVEAWLLSGRSIPDYSREDMPGVVWRDGEGPPDHAA